MRASVTCLVLSFILGAPTWNSHRLAAVQNPKTVITDSSPSFDCAAPNAYSVAEVWKQEARYVDIKQGDKVLGSIRIFTGVERNGFALDEAKKTQTGFEISVEYGSVIYYHKVFVFICRQHKFYLSKIKVDSFNKHNP